MRLAGTFLIFLGLIGALVGTFSGFGSFFSWNGRHVVRVRELASSISDPTAFEAKETWSPIPGRRYSVSVQVAFDRDRVPTREGAPALSSKMPLVMRVTDEAKTTFAETRGWLDPDEPPNVVHGRSALESARGPAPELAVERLVGPFIASSSAPLSVDVHLGGDRIGLAPVVSRRLVIHDDALPPSIRNAFIVAGVGMVVFAGGVTLLVVRWHRGHRGWRRGRSRRKRGGIPTATIV